MGPLDSHDNMTPVFAFNVCSFSGQDGNQNDNIPGTDKKERKRTNIPR